MLSLTGFFTLIAETWAGPVQSHIPVGTELHGQGNWEEAEPHNRSCAVKMISPQPDQGDDYCQL